MSSNIVNSQLEHNFSPQSSHTSASILTQSMITEEPSSLDQYNKRTTPRSYSSSVSSGSSGSSTISTQPETTQQPQQPQPQQKQQVIQPSHSPSRAKKLVDKFATFSPKMKSKSDRKLVVETAYCNRNAKKDGTQPEQRPSKLVENAKPLKKKKRTPINITEGMSRADIFAANVASAVDAAEDEEEEEDYIYSNCHPRTSSVTSESNGTPRSQTIPFPHMPSDDNYGYPYHMPPNMYGAISPSSHRSYNNYIHRPPFYGGYYNDTSGPETDVISNQFDRGGSQSNLISSKPNGVMRSSLPDMSQYIYHKKVYPNYAPTNYPYNYWYDDDERLPLFAKWRPPNYDTRQRQSCAPTISSLTVIIVFLLASSYLIYFASTRPLAEVSITGISNVLAADKELMFNIHVKGRNYGIWNIEVVNADLNVFATPVENNVPGIPGGPGSHWDDATNGVTPSEFLGSILIFDEPLVFAAGINQTGVLSEPSGQVRLQNPGGKNDKEGQDRWSYIIRRQYDLTVRGVLIYSLPFLKDRRVRVCYAVRVDSANGVGGDDYTLTSNTNNDMLGACGDWEKEQDKTDIDD